MRIIGRGSLLVAGVMALACDMPALQAAPARAGSARPADGPPDSKAKPQEEKFDLPDGTMLEYAQKKKLNQRAYVPDEKMFRPYAGASVGPRIAFTMVDGSNLVTAPAARQIVRDTVNRLLGAWTGPAPDLDVQIEAKSGYAAMATEQGVMLVPLGVFDPDPKKGVASVDELALLVGHELAHYLLRHIEHQGMRRAIVNRLAMAASGWVTYGAVKKTNLDGDKLTVAADPATVRRAHLVGLATTMLIGDLLSPSFDRRNEYEADLLAIDLAIKAGYDISESEMENFITRHTADAIEMSGRMQRLQGIVQLASVELSAKITQKTGNPLGIDIGGLIGAASIRMIGSAFDDLAKMVKPHPDPAVRVAIMKRYFERSYATLPESDQLRQKQVVPLRTLARSGTVSPVLANLKRAEEECMALALEGGTPAAAESKATGGIGASAVKIADAQAGKADAAAPKSKGSRSAQAGRSIARTVKAVTTRPSPGRPPLGNGAESYSSFVEGNVQAYRLANHNLARAAWQRSADGTYPSLEGARDLAGDFAADDQRAGLIPVADRLGKLFGTTDPLLDLAVGAAIAKGDVAGAETLAARCVTFEGGHLYAYCIQQLGYDPLQKGVTAKTPEGRKAFSGKSIERQFSFISVIGDLFR